jgi:thiol-disulfide isomerase/thioredoxin
MKHYVQTVLMTLFVLHFQPFDALATTPSSQPSKNTAKTGHVAFRTFSSFQAAINEAKRLKKPIFLDLFAIWCVPCKKLERVTFTDPVLRPLLKQYLLVRFDTGKPAGRALMQQFAVTRFPTTLMLSPEGKERERVVGYYAARYFVPAVKAGITGKGTFHQLLKEAQKKPVRPKLLLTLADRAVLRRLVYHARNIYQKLWKLDGGNRRGIGAWALFGIARSYARIGQYRNALTWLELYASQYGSIIQPSSLEAARLHLHVLKRQRKQTEYNKRFKVFQQTFPGLSHIFK